MRYTVREIAHAIDAEATGDLDLTILKLSEPFAAGPNDLAVAINPKYAEKLNLGRARAAILWADADWYSFGLAAAILPKNPRFTMAKLTEIMDLKQGFEDRIHPSAIIDPSARIGVDVTIGPGAVIGPNAKIGPRCVIGPLSFIGWKTEIGSESYIREQVSIGAGVSIGERFIANPGARIAGDGFSFVTPEPNAVDAVRATLGVQEKMTPQRWSRIHSLGSVTIGDDVEIGANTTIDSGTIRPTRIGHRTKIDSLVHIAHNVIVGHDTLICGQAGLAGSVTIGNHVIIAGQVGVADNLTIGDCVVLGAACKVLTSVRAGKVMLGYPATEMRSQIDAYKSLRRLPRIMRDIAAIKKAVFKSDNIS